MAEGPVLQGTHVRLRPLLPSDAEVTFAWRQGERARLLNRGSRTVDEQRRWIASRPSTELNFVIELDDGRPVGMLSLVDIDRTHRRAEPARFLIGDEEAARGTPVAVEAMKLLYAYAFDTLGMERLYGTISEENRLMIKWQRFFGMKVEGRLRRHYFMNGHFQDAVCVGLLAEEYRREALPRMEAMIAARSGTMGTKVPQENG